MAAITSAQSGDWSDTDTWTGGVVPVEGDTVTIQNGHTVTIDDLAAATIIVGADTTTAAINIAAGGKLQYLSTATVDHILQLKGDIKVYGTLEIGTDSNPIPITRTFTIKLNYSASLVAGEFGLIAYDGSTVTMRGATRTYVKCKLNTDEAAGQTVLGVDTDTGWKQDDEVCIAGTTRTYTQNEKRTLASDAGANSITVTSGLSYAHDGTSPVQADIGLLTRNVKITSYNATYNGYILINATAIVTLKYIQISEIGYAATDKFGIVVKTTTGSVTISYCSIEANAYGIRGSSALTGTITYNDNILYNTDSYFMYIEGSSTTSTWNVYNNLCIRNAGTGIYLVSGRINFYDNIIANVNGTSINTSSGYNLLSFHDITVYGGSGIGIQLGLCTYTLPNLYNLNIYRNNNTGFYLVDLSDIKVLDSNIWGNSSYNLSLSDASYYYIQNITFDNCTFNSDVTYTTTTEIQFNSNIANVKFIDCSFGIVGGIKTTASYLTYNNSISPVEIYFINCYITETNITASGSYDRFTPNTVLQSHNHNNTIGRYKKWVFTQEYSTNVAGIISDQITGGQIEAWARGGSGLCIYLDPKFTDVYLPWKFLVPCTASTAFNVKMYVKKTSSGANCLLKFSASGAGITEIDRDSVTLTDAWVEYTSPTMTPTETGFVEVIIEAIDGATTGDIGIDDISVA